MPLNEEMMDRLFSDRDDDSEESGYGGGGSASYDEDEDEDGGWAINKDHSDSLWDSTDDSDDDDEEGGVAPVAGAEDADAPLRRAQG